MGRKGSGEMKNYATTPQARTLNEYNYDHEFAHDYRLNCFFKNLAY